MGRFNRQKISKDIVELNNAINQLDIIDIYRLLYPITLHSQAHMEHSSDRSHWAIKHVFKNVKGHIIIELKINNRKTTGKPPNINTQILNNILLINTQLEEKSQK